MKASRHRQDRCSIFRALCTAYRTDKSLQAAIDACDHTCSFDSAWAEQGLCVCFDQLFRFVGGLTLPIPNTAPVESDYSSLKVRKYAFNKSLTDFSLEGFLQFKHFDMLMRLKTVRRVRRTHFKHND